MLAPGSTSRSGVGVRYHASADGLAVADRLLSLLEAPPTIGSGGTAAAPSPAAAVVRLEGVSFSYPARPGLVLDGVDSSSGRARPWRWWASSAGKSTVGRMLMLLARRRLLEP